MAASAVRAIGTIVVLAGLFTASAAAAQSSSDAAALLNRIEFLERQIRLLSDRVGTSQAAAPDAAGARQPSAEEAAGGSASTARLAVRLSELEQDLRSVTGRLEDLNYQLRQLSERFEKLSNDIDYRLGQQSPGSSTGTAMASPPTASTGTRAEPMPQERAPAPAAPSPAHPPQPQEGGPRVLAPGPTPGDEAVGGEGLGGGPARSTSTEQSAALPQGTPREQYTHAFNLMHDENYDEAGAAFQEFLSRNPNDPLAQNAYYWLGETYYRRRNYAQAASTFLEGYEKYKTGSKAPDTLLKLGMSLARLKKTPEACATFKELGRAFPGAPTEVKAKANEESKQLGCR